MLTCFKSILKILHSNYLYFYSNLPVRFGISVKSTTFWQFLLCFLFINKTVRLSNLKTRTAMFICVEVIIYLLSHNLHDCTCTFKLLDDSGRLKFTEVSLGWKFHRWKKMFFERILKTNCAKQAVCTFITWNE